MDGSESTYDALGCLLLAWLLFAGLLVVVGVVWGGDLMTVTPRDKTACYFTVCERLSWAHDPRCPGMSGCVRC